jgi:hypothetical protein
MQKIRNINCKFNDRGTWCKCRRVKRSLWGIGARLCVEFDSQASGTCIYREAYHKPSYPAAPPPPPSRESLSVADKVELAFDAHNNINARLENRIVELEDALQFYADEHTYTKRGEISRFTYHSPIAYDSGHRARQTLKGEPNESKESEV